MNALVLMCLCLWLLSLPITPEDEYQIIRLTSLLKNIGLGYEKKPLQTDFLFVNVAYSKELVPKFDETEIFPIGNEAITNREKLALLIRNLENIPYKYLLTDIHFVGKSPNDSILNKELAKSNRIVVSYHYNLESGKYEHPVFDVNKGLSDYTANKESIIKQGEGFLKFEMMQNDSVPSLPLVMYQDLTGEGLTEGKLFYELGNRKVLNDFILNFRIRRFDLFESKNPYLLLNIADLLIMNQDVLRQFTEDRIIVIGDFTDRDIHDTIYGKTPGSLILVNAYLALLNRDNEVRLQLFVLLFIIFYGLSLMAFYSQEKSKDWLRGRIGLQSVLLKHFFGFMFYFLILVIVSITSFFLYNIHLNVFFLASELYGISIIGAFIRKRRLLKI